MSLYTERIADLQEIERDLPHTFQHGTGDAQVSGPCILTMARRGMDLIVGGKLKTVRQVLFVRCELFTAAEPQKDQPIKFRADTTESFTEYRIAEVRKSADGAHYELALVSLSE